MSDEMLIQKIENGEESAIKEAMQKYSGLLWKIASAILLPAAQTEDVEECVADVFIYMWQNPGKYESKRGSLKVWLTVLTRSKAIDRYRMVVKRSETELFEEIVFEKSDILQEIIRREEKEQVIEYLHWLDERARDMIIRRFYYGQKPKEIALVYGIPKKQVENCLYRAKQKIKDIMTADGKGKVSG